METFLMILIGFALVGIVMLYFSKAAPKKPTSRKVVSTPKQTFTNSDGRKTHHAIRDWTREEVATHNKKDDLFLIVNNRVYDVTSFVATHPGGMAIMNNPGKDNTTAFFGDQHPETVKDQIEEYFVGKLKD